MELDASYIYNRIRLVYSKAIRRERKIIHTEIFANFPVVCEIIHVSLKI